MHYHQLTSDERDRISVLRMQGSAPSEIANELGRDRVSKAISRTRGRRSRSRRDTQFGHEDLKIVKRFLRKKWSPVQILKTLRKRGVLSINHETIYKLSGETNPSVASSTRTYAKPKRIVESAIISMIPEAYSRGSAIFLSDLRPSKSVKEWGTGRSTR